tara:strand:+ start:257 stop:529 length:273 start_codon:yes stop_codon:yes gene_type:complete
MIFPIFNITTKINIALKNLKSILIDFIEIIMKRIEKNIIIFLKDKIKPPILRMLKDVNRLNVRSAIKILFKSKLVDSFEIIFSMNNQIVA